MLDRLLELAANPRLIAFFGLCLGLYLLGDLARVFFYIFDSSRRRRRGRRDPAAPGSTDTDRPCS
jgi:hypothetical protein